jgi:hypothetical protein
MEKLHKRKLHIIQKIAIGIMVFGMCFSGWFGWNGAHMDSEGKYLIERIGAAQKVYYSAHNRFYDIGDTPISYCPELGIDARKNKYYKLFSGDADENSFTLRVDGDKDTVYAQDNHFIVNGNKDTWEVTNFDLDSKYKITIPY